ncbi:hypothetical protein HGRIS_004799 [Hohenbuehelia grisea]|uniref:F-box domain-containing protein n=1 Tax=Hohenbuehelia grisea TaxID=104357 RepID=A0ABR3JEN1_9AGAR
MTSISRVSGATHHSTTGRPMPDDTLAATAALESLSLSKSFASKPLTGSNLAQRRAHNACVSVSCLPEEILCQIFIALARSCSLKCPEWIRVSYVCHFWRQSALSCSDLWRHIDLNHPRWATLTLDRAGLRPLVVRANVREETLNLFRRVVAAEMQRVEEVDVIFSSQRDFQRVHESFLTPAPMLRSLKMDIVGSERIGLPIPPQPLAHPDLQRLELIGCPFEWVSPPHINLTYLNISHLPSKQLPDRDNFFSVLRSLPSLEHLELCQAFPLPALPNSAPTPPAHLPKLQHLAISGSSLEVLDVLSMLSHPPNIYLICCISTSANFEADCTALATAFGRYVSARHRTTPLELLAVSLRETSKRYTNAYWAPNPEFDQLLRIRGYFGKTEPNFDFCIRPKSLGSDRIVIRGLELILAALPLERVRTISLAGVYNVTEETWLAVLEPLQLSSLISLIIEGRPSTSLFWALLRNARDNPAHLLLPSLSNLLLHQVDCAEYGYISWDSRGFPLPAYPHLDGIQFQDLLCRFVEKRKIRHPRRLYLKIMRCNNLRKDNMGKLKGTCDVDWDGVGSRDIPADEPSVVTTFCEASRFYYTIESRDSELAL